MKKILFLLVYGFSFCGSLWAQTSEYQNVWCADKGNGTYVNPVINGDFPDIDVVFVDGIYYMVSTTMYHFPGATILKSKDLVNWEYCANPLEQVLDNVMEKAQQAGETLLSAVVSTAIKSAAYAVVYVVSFLLLLILLRLALTPLHLFTKLPVVHGVNAVLGGALGLVKGALLLFLVVWALQKWQLFITPEMVEKSFLLKFFAANSPMDLIAKL